MGVRFSCPDGYQTSPLSPIACVAKCPADKQYELRLANGQPRCVYKPDSQYFVDLHQVPAIQHPDKTPIPDIRTTDVKLYNQYQAESQRFGGEIAVVDSKIEKSTKVANAFKALQDAENVRDQSPQAYQTARIRYYTLIKGDGWIEEEKQRLAKSEVSPVVQNYASQYQTLMNNVNSQKKTIDVVQGVKDKVLTIKDELAFSANAFQKQLGEIKNQINIERETQERTKVDSMSWIDFLLNLLLVFILIVAVFVVLKKVVERLRPAPYRNI